VFIAGVGKGGEKGKKVGWEGGGGPVSDDVERGGGGSDDSQGEIGGERDDADGEDHIVKTDKQEGGGGGDEELPGSTDGDGSTTNSEDDRDEGEDTLAELTLDSSLPRPGLFKISNPR